MQVNGHDLQHVKHDQGVALLAKQRDHVALVVRHEKAPPGLMVKSSLLLTSAMSTHSKNELLEKK